MKYNDFQIFNDDTFSTLSSHYFTNKKNERIDLANKLYFELSSCFYMCFANKNYNNKIISSIEKTKNILNNLIDNLKANFSLAEISQKNYKDCNIFQIVNKLLTSIELCNIWLKQEEKEYFKYFLNNFISNLIDLNLILISSLEKSSIKFYKFM